MNAEIVQQHINSGLTIKEIALATDTSYTTVRYYLRKYNLTVPPYTKKHACACGVTNPQQFYGKTKQICKTCFNRNSLSRWKHQKQRAVAYKGGKCVKCGYNKCISALEFHHRDPSKKEFAWDSMRKQAWPKVIEELDKCDLLCANCHRETHEDIRKIPASSSVDRTTAF